MSRVLITACSLLSFALCGTGQDLVFLPCQPFGGQQAVDALFEHELRFPDDALAEGIDGISTLIFTVDADGTLRDLRVWQPLSPSCDLEALRLARMVRWHPATLGGEPHAAEHYLKVPFEPKQYRRWLKNRSEQCASLTARANDPTGQIYRKQEVDSLAAPRIPSGMKGLQKHLLEHLRYPPDAFRRDLQGTVRIEFVVEPTGTLSNMRALDELGAGCTEEAMRLVRDICWRPAIKNDVRVRSTQEVSILFRITLSPNERY